MKSLLKFFLCLFAVSAMAQTNQYYGAFNGALTGSASYATQATQDQHGNAIDLWSSEFETLGFWTFSELNPSGTLNMATSTGTISFNTNGNFSATSFTGNGSGLTNLSASSLVFIPQTNSLVIVTNAVFSNSGTVPTVAGSVLTIPTNWVSGGGGGGISGAGVLYSNVIQNTLTNVTVFESNINPTNSSTNLVLNGSFPVVLGNLSYYTQPVLMARPLNGNNQLVVDIMPNMGATTNSTNCWMDIVNSDIYTNGSTGGASYGSWFHMQVDANANCHITPYSYSGGPNGTLYLADHNSGNQINIGASSDWTFNQAYGGSGEAVGGDLINMQNGNSVFKNSVNGKEFQFLYQDSSGNREFMAISNITASTHLSTLNLMRTGGWLFSGAGTNTFQNTISAPTNNANFTVNTNDLVPGAWNIGPNARFSVATKVSNTSTLTVAAASYLLYSNAVTGLITKQGYNSIPAGILAADTETNTLTIPDANPLSLFALTNDAGANVTAIHDNSTLVSAK